MALKVLDDIFHFKGRFHEEATETNRIGLVFLSGLNNRISRLFDPQIDDAESVVRQDDVHQVLPNIVNVTFHCCEHYRAFC